MRRLASSACPPRRAAFFDLDKTVIARASMVAMGKPLYREGLISRWLLLRALWGQLVYLWVGADEEKLARMRDSVLRLAAGWERDRVRRIARDAIEEVIEPIVYDEALELIAEHQDAGRARVHRLGVTRGDRRPARRAPRRRRLLATIAEAGRRRPLHRAGRALLLRRRTRPSPCRAGRAARARPRRELRLLRLRHRRADARRRRPPRGGQPRPGAAAHRPRARVGGAVVRAAGAAARPDPPTPARVGGRRGRRAGCGGGRPRDLAVVAPGAAGGAGTPPATVRPGGPSWRRGCRGR